jgi:hypothetical protein
MNEQERADYFRLPRGSTPESLDPQSEQGAAYMKHLDLRAYVERLVTDMEAMENDD